MQLPCLHAEVPHKVYVMGSDERLWLVVAASATAAVDQSFISYFQHIQVDYYDR